MAKAFLTGTTPLSHRAFMCAALGCLERVSRTRAAGFFCDKHWHLIPSDVRALLERKFRATKITDDKWTRPFAQFMDLAVQELRSIDHCGHRIPQPRDFMWDDPPAVEGAAAGQKPGSDDAT